MKAKDLPEFDPAEYLTDEETIVAYLIDAAKDNDPAYLQKALGDVARSTIGMTALAQTTGAGRESLYKALSANGNAGLGTIMKVLDALGLHMTFEANKAAA